MTAQPAGGVALPVMTTGAACAAAAVVMFADPTSPGEGFPLPPCPVKFLTGFDCPGCGSTRVLYSLLHGDVLTAFDYNAGLVLFLPFFLWTWTAWVLGRWNDRRYSTWEQWRWAPVTALVLILVWTLVRNLPFAPFTALASDT